MVGAEATVGIGAEGAATIGAEMGAGVNSPTDGAGAGVTTVGTTGRGSGNGVVFGLIVLRQ
jgi:hypothetical protein